MILENHIKTYQKEVEAALIYCHSYDFAMKLLSKPENNVEKNKNYFFWRIFATAVLSNLFICLGRIYDTHNNSFNFNKFIKLCKKNIGEFSLQTIEIIKSRSADGRPEWLDEYLANCHNATIADLDDIHSMERSCRKRFSRNYIHMRHKIFAHAEITENDDINKILKQNNINIAEIIEYLNIHWSIYNQIFCLYYNGRKPTLEIIEYGYKQDIEDGIRLALLGK